MVPLVPGRRLGCELGLFRPEIVRGHDSSIGGLYARRVAAVGLVPVGGGDGDEWLHSAPRVAAVRADAIHNTEEAGNAAGDGAGMMLCSDKNRRRAEDIAANATFLNLKKHPTFNRKFAMSLQFP